MVAASTLVGLWIAPRWGTAPVDMIYLPAVLAAAALWGLGPGLSPAITSALAYNFFFTAPVHTLRIDRVADIVTVSVLLIVALVTGRLAARHPQAGADRRRPCRPQRGHCRLCPAPAVVQHARRRSPA